MISKIFEKRRNIFSIVFFSLKNFQIKFFRTFTFGWKVIQKQISSNEFTNLQTMDFILDICLMATNFEWHFECVEKRILILFWVDFLFWV